MKKTFIFLIVTMIMSINLSQAQIISGSEAKAVVYNAESVALINDDYLPSLINFSKGGEIELSNLQAWLSDNFKLPSSFGLKFIKSESDQIGYTHYRYQQTYNGYPVVGGDYIAHVKNGKVVSVNGIIKKYVESSTSIALTENDALQKALNSVNATTYKWQIPQDEKMLKYINNDQNATYYPKGELMVVPEDGNYESTNFSLAYRFDIYATEPLSRQYIFVDVKSGKIIAKLNRICTTDAVGTAVTKYSGTQPITTDMVSSSSYRLRETGRGLGVETYNLKNGTSTGSAVDFTDTDNNWNNVNTAQDEIATDAHWGAEKTYDYYFTNYGRNSLDNAGYKLVSYVHYSSNYNNAMWDGSAMNYGDGDGTTYTPFTALDICGHEITHGLTTNTANLTYQGESGALNEGYSDIFGTCIEFYAKPSMAGWSLGENIGTIVRDLSNPNGYSLPDTYNGTYWASTSGLDNGGVHTNSGVVGYWFYLTTEGGTGTNDIGNAYSVNGIGMTKAAAIAYRTLTYYLTASSNYAAARTYSIQAATDLYGGACTPEVIATTNAWYAVGVGTASTGSASAFTSDNTSYCTVPAVIQFTNQTVGATSYHWDFGDGSTSTLTNPSHTYTSGGNYDVKLVSYGGSCGTDSVIKTSFIHIDLPPAPTTTGAGSPVPASLTLSASGTGTLSWYDAATGGNLVATGNQYITPVLSATTTYYVQNNISYPTQSAGMAAKTTTGGYYTSTARQGEVFTATVPLTIKSVVVYANTTANRTIFLKNSSGTVIDSLVTSITSGTQTVTLNFDVAPGTGYILGCSSNNSLWRETGGATYPMTVNGLISITGNTAGSTATAYYYYFYNWQIDQPSCSSEMTPVTAVIDPNVGISEYSESSFTVNPNPSNGLIKIESGYTSTDHAMMEITDLIGQSVYSEPIISDSQSFNIGDLPKGLYLLKVRINNSISTKKIIIGN